MSTTDQRLERELEFHNERFAENPERDSRLSRAVHEITLSALRRVYDEAYARCKGKDVLDYGCAEGQASILLSRHGASTVSGIDLSDVAIDHAREAVRRAGVDNATFQVMNAEVLEFADDSFDLVFGIGILHHLDIDTAAAELARVLRPGGSVVLLEPMGHNPGINLFRKLTPSIRTEDEHPLRAKDLRGLTRFFAHTEYKFTNLSSLATVPLYWMPGRDALTRGLRAFDESLFRLVPFLGRYAWNVVMVMSQPRATAH